MFLDEALTAANAGMLELPWTESTWLKVRGSLASLPRVYPQLGYDGLVDQIVCNPDELVALVAPYKKSKTVPANCRFKSFQSFYDWQSNAKRFFDHVSGRKAHSAGLRHKVDGGAKLLHALAHVDDGKPLFSGQELIPLVALIGCCREDGLDLRDITRGWVVDLIGKSSAGRATTIRDATALIDALADDVRIPVDLLPAEIFGDLAGIGYAGHWRTPELHQDFKQARDDYIRARSNGSKRARLGSGDVEITTHKKIGPSWAKSIRQAVDWFHHGLVAAGMVKIGSPFPWEAVSNPQLLKEVAELDASGAMHRQTQAATRGKRVKEVVKFLDTVFQGYRSGVSMDFFDFDILNNPENFETSKSEWKREVTLNFVQDRSLQKIYYDMPSRFYNEAKDLIAHWDQIGPKRGVGRLSKAQGRALDLAMIAVHLTITTRFPLRLKTVLSLTVAGRKPNIIMPRKNSSDPVKVHVPGYIVKNKRLFDGVPLLPSASFDPAELFRWYIDKVRPLVIEHKVRGKNKAPNLLFCGATRDPVANKFKRLTAEAGLKLDAHMVRHLAGSILYARGIRVPVIAELLGITENTVRENYLHIDRTALLQKAIDEIAKIYRELE